MTAKASDLAISAYGRGVCPECGRDTALTKAGKLRHHGGAPGTGSIGWGRAYRCPGTGKGPRPDRTLAYCETSTATVMSPVHVRVVGPEGLKTGGGAPGAALCGRDLRHGWDLRVAAKAELTNDRVDADPDRPGHTCRTCRDAALGIGGEGLRGEEAS